MLKQKKTQKWTLIIFIFLLVITAIRISWMGFLETLDYDQTPSANHGVLDLRGMKFTDKQTLKLNGEWEFYPSTFKTSKEKTNEESLVYLKVPNNWDTVLDRNQPFNYGTYRLRILLDDNNKKQFGIKFNKINNASAIYVNGHLINQSGQASTMVNQHQGSNIPHSVSVNPTRNEIELIILVSSDRNNGGIVKPIRFGTEEAILYQDLLSKALQVILVVVLLLHFIYAVILYFIRSIPNKGLLYLSSLLLCSIVSVLVSDDKLLFNWISIDYSWEVKVVYLSYIGVGAFIPLVIMRLFPTYINKWILRCFVTYCILYGIFTLLASPSCILYSSKVLLFAVFLFSIIISTISLLKAKMGKDESIFLILSCLSIGVNIIWATFKNNTSLELMHYPFDLIIALLCYAAFWFKRFFQNASEAKHLAEKLQLENQRKDEFLVNTSHELRNPLHGITNIIQLLLGDKVNPLHEEQRRRLSILMNVSKRMSFMLNDLLDVTRLNEKTIQLKVDGVNIHSVVTGVLDMVKLMTQGKPIRLQIIIPDPFPSVMADENRLVQILYNLIDNAVKFTDEGIITIRATIENEMARIYIEDTGIGIEEDELQRVFEPYEQVNDSKRESGGFGLGLSICKQLIELHHGTLSVHSIPGQGSVFSFTLPLFKNDDKIKIEKNTSLILNEINEVAATIDGTFADGKLNIKGKGRILLVDDDPINLNILSTILEGEGYMITGVTSAYRALATLEKEPYHLVISDVMMPQISGYELTRIIRKRFSISELPILLLTARTRTDDILTGFQSGANDYVLKPIDSLELMVRVRALTKLKKSIEDRVRMEGAWLQSQIQPHFIFNTFNSIAALGEIDIAKMQELIEEFSHYLRQSFDFHNADSVVPLEQELSLVQSYLYIEKTRFGSRLKIEWELDDNINLLLPPLSIQPLVENAVKHGVLQHPEGGTVCIRIKRRSNHIEVAIIDNGKGMTKEEIEDVLTGKHHNNRTSVGIRNVNRRLKQLYGRGLIIQSKPEFGTTVTFYISKE